MQGSAPSMADNLDLALLDLPDAIVQMHQDISRFQVSMPQELHHEDRYAEQTADRDMHLQMHSSWINHGNQDIHGEDEGMDQYPRQQDGFSRSGLPDTYQGNMRPGEFAERAFANDNYQHEEKGQGQDHFGQGSRNRPYDNSEMMDQDQYEHEGSRPLAWEESRRNFLEGHDARQHAYDDRREMDHGPNDSTSIDHHLLRNREESNCERLDSDVFSGVNQGELLGQQQGAYQDLRYIEQEHVQRPNDNYEHHDKDQQLHSGHDDAEAAARQESISRSDDQQAREIHTERPCLAQTILHTEVYGFPQTVLLQLFDVLPDSRY